MKYHAQNRRRDKLPIRGLPRLEKEMVKNLKEVLFEQTDEAISDELVAKASKMWHEIKRSKSEQEKKFEAMLLLLIQRQLPLLDNSKYSLMLQAILVKYYQESLKYGVLKAKRDTVSMLMNTKDEDFIPIVQSIDTTKFNLTNEHVLTRIHAGSANQTRDVNDTTIQRISRFVRDGVIAGAVTKADLGMAEINGIQSRRSWNISRDTLMEAAIYGYGYYADEMNVEYWTWTCQSPIDDGCLVACGATVAVGDPFPNGLTEPQVHKNCCCSLDYAMNPNMDDVSMSLFKMSLAKGRDWSGE